MGVENLTDRVRNYPDILQGGMGIAISSWKLAGEVAAKGAMGVVSGTVISEVFARRLQDGDMDEPMKQALAEFPDQDLVNKIVDRYYLPGGRMLAQPYKGTPVFGLRSNGLAVELNLLGAYTEVRRAQIHAQRITGHENSRGPIGINLLTKLELSTPSALFGAMLAGVDCVVMGAGIPSDIPVALDNLSQAKATATQFNVNGAEQHYDIKFDPNEYPKLAASKLTRPAFLAIVASKSLAKFLSRDQQSSPNGFVIEGPTAGGHNAPPRGKLELDDQGQPIYGPRDEVDLEDFAKLDKPFWCAGGYGTPEGLITAKAQGANGIQVGSIFAVCQDSGIVPWARAEIIHLSLDDSVDVVTSAQASSTGYPFKVAQVGGSLSEEAVYNARPRICDQRFLSEAYINDSGNVSFRCPAEPIEQYISDKKGGDIAATVGRVCLCNGLLAAAGLAQIRKNQNTGPAYQEPPIFTLGDSANESIKLLVNYLKSPHFRAKDVIDWLRSG